MKNGVGTLLLWMQCVMLLNKGAHNYSISVKSFDIFFALNQAAARTVNSSFVPTDDDGFFLLSSNVTIRCEGVDIFPSSQLLLEKRDEGNMIQSLSMPVALIATMSMDFAAVLEYEIVNLQEDDTGEYFCIVSGGMTASVNDSVEINIIGKSYKKINYIILVKLQMV